MVTITGDMSKKPMANSRAAGKSCHLLLDPLHRIGVRRLERAQAR
jgi:hypothetical protein